MAEDLELSKAIVFLTKLPDRVSKIASLAGQVGASLGAGPHIGGASRNGVGSKLAQALGALHLETEHHLRTLERYHRTNMTTKATG